MKASWLPDKSIKFSLEEGEDPEVIRQDHVEPFLKAFAVLIDRTGEFCLTEDSDAEGNTIGYVLEKINPAPKAVASGIPEQITEERHRALAS